jgi:hypothetical protein
MLTAFWHLAVRAWGAMIAASSTSTFGLGVWTFMLALAVWVAGVGREWRRFHKAQEKSPFREAVRASKETAVYEIGTIVVVAMLVWGVFVIRTIYYLRTGMRYAYTQEIQRNKDLKAQLEHREKEMDTSDPVFGNTVHLLGAFSGFRDYLHGESCVVHITAPNESMGFASMVAQFSIATSNCPTFGPDGVGFDRNPDLAHATLDGMEPNVIVFHAARDDKAANELFAQLSNLMPLKRSYDPLANAARFYQTPSGGYAHTVWLQFGPNAGWIGETRRGQ